MKYNYDDQLVPLQCRFAVCFYSGVALLLRDEAIVADGRLQGMQSTALCVAIYLFDSMIHSPLPVKTMASRGSLKLGPDDTVVPACYSVWIFYLEMNRRQQLSAVPKTLKLCATARTTNPIKEQFNPSRKGIAFIDHFHFSFLVTPFTFIPSPSGC